MKRDLSQLTYKAYDVLVIGGGIYGACVARDAALRGLSVALVDLPPRTSPPSKLDSEPFEVHSTG